jgi:two-component system, LuxR family, response regulator FixJ
MRDHYPTYVVDDDPQIRDSISILLDLRGHAVGGFASGDEFLSALPLLDAGAILLDMRMPGSDGVAVLERLQQRSVGWPVIGMTGHGEVPLAVNAMKLGAIEFLEKPFREEELTDALDRAHARLRAAEQEEASRSEAVTRVRSLSARELQMLQALLNGLSNKQIANALEISIRTVEMHRASLMRKLQARSVADAVILATEAGMRRGPQLQPD